MRAEQALLRLIVLAGSASAMLAFGIGAYGSLDYRARLLTAFVALALLLSTLFLRWMPGDQSQSVSALRRWQLPWLLLPWLRLGSVFVGWDGEAWLIGMLELLIVLGSVPVLVYLLLQLLLPAESLSRLQAAVVALCILIISGVAFMVGLAQSWIFSCEDFEQSGVAAPLDCWSSGPIALQLTRRDDAVVLEGELDSSSPAMLLEYLDTHPDIDTLALQDVPGSVDVVATQQLGRQLRARGVATAVPANGYIASGGTDLFLAGERRVVGEGACIGVHSWAEGVWPLQVDGDELARTDPAHASGIDYLRDIGIDEAFYWFTLDAAGPERMYWLTREDVNRFGLSSEPLPEGFVLGEAGYCDAL